jgi:hypothetical protein
MTRCADGSVDGEGERDVVVEGRAHVDYSVDGG